MSNDDLVDLYTDFCDDSVANEPSYNELRARCHTLEQETRQLVETISTLASENKALLADKANLNHLLAEQKDLYERKLRFLNERFQRLVGCGKAGNEGDGVKEAAVTCDQLQQQPASGISPSTPPHKRRRSNSREESGWRRQQRRDASRDSALPPPSKHRGIEPQQHLGRRQRVRGSSPVPHGRRRSRSSIERHSGRSPITPTEANGFDCRPFNGPKTPPSPEPPDEQPFEPPKADAAAAAVAASVDSRRCRRSISPKVSRPAATTHRSSERHRREDRQSSRHKELQPHSDASRERQFAVAYSKRQRYQEMRHKQQQQQLRQRRRKLADRDSCRDTRRSHQRCEDGAHRSRSPSEAAVVDVADDVDNNKLSGTPIVDIPAILKADISVPECSPLHSPAQLLSPQPQLHSLSSSLAVVSSGGSSAGKQISAPQSQQKIIFNVPDTYRTAAGVVVSDEEAMEEASAIAAATASEKSQSEAAAEVRATDACTLMRMHRSWAAREAARKQHLRDSEAIEVDSGVGSSHPDQAHTPDEPAAAEDHPSEGLPHRPALRIAAPTSVEAPLEVLIEDPPVQAGRPRTPSTTPPPTPPLSKPALPMSPPPTPAVRPNAQPSAQKTPSSPHASPQLEQLSADSKLHRRRSKSPADRSVKSSSKSRSSKASSHRRHPPESTSRSRERSRGFSVQSRRDRSNHRGVSRSDRRESLPRPGRRSPSSSYQHRADSKPLHSRHSPRVRDSTPPRLARRLARKPKAAELQRRLLTSSNDARVAGTEMVEEGEIVSDDEPLEFVTAGKKAAAEVALYVADLESAADKNNKGHRDKTSGRRLKAQEPMRSAVFSKVAQASPRPSKQGPSDTRASPKQCRRRPSGDRQSEGAGFASSRHREREPNRHRRSRSKSPLQRRSRPIQSSVVRSWRA